MCLDIVKDIQNFMFQKFSELTYVQTTLKDVQ
jgi:hypothetical protein